MRIKFKYNGKIYSPVHPENKLKKLGITWDDVEIIEEQVEEVTKEEYSNPRLYEFRNRKTGETILSIYDTLDDLTEIIDVNDYVFIKMVEYENN